MTGLNPRKFSIIIPTYGLKNSFHTALRASLGKHEMQIKDGYNGWLVEPNNVEALKERMEYVIDHRSILPKMSNNCAAISIQEHCDKLLEIYKSLIS